MFSTNRGVILHEVETPPLLYTKAAVFPTMFKKHCVDVALVRFHCNSKFHE